MTIRSRIGTIKHWASSSGSMRRGSHDRQSTSGSIASTEATPPSPKTTVSVDKTPSPASKEVDVKEDVKGEVKPTAVVGPITEEPGSMLESTVPSTSLEAAPPVKETAPTTIVPPFQLPSIEETETAEPPRLVVAGAPDAYLLTSNAIFELESTQAELHSATAELLASKAETELLRAHLNTTNTQLVATNVLLDHTMTGKEDAEREVAVLRARLALLEAGAKEVEAPAKEVGVETHGKDVVSPAVEESSSDEESSSATSEDTGRTTPALATTPLPTDKDTPTDVPTAPETSEGITTVPSPAAEGKKPAPPLSHFWSFALSSWNSPAR